jgi:hypothetical protein
MKKLPILLLTLVLFTTAIKAQVEIKALVGTNFSILTKPPEGADVAAKAGYQFGAGVLIGDKFYVEPGIQFVRNSRTFTAESEEVKIDQNFVKVPVYVGYHLLGHESGPVALRIFGGPAVSFAGKLKKGSDQISEDDLKKGNFMVDAGLGLDILFLFVEANYEYAFTKYFESGDYDSNHSGFNINAGIHIDF